MLIDLIKNNAEEEMNQKNWNSVANKIKAFLLRDTPRKCYSVETGYVLESVGINWKYVMELFDEDVVGRFLLSKLALDGVEWAHPMTVSYLETRKNNILTEAGIEVLLNLSAPLLHSNLTADDCKIAVQNYNAQKAFMLIDEFRRNWDQISIKIRNCIETGEIKSNKDLLEKLTQELEN